MWTNHGAFFECWGSGLLLATGEREYCVQPSEAVTEDHYRHANLHQEFGGVRSSVVHQMYDAQHNKDHSDGDHSVEIKYEAPLSAAMKFGMSSCPPV